MKYLQRSLSRQRTKTPTDWLLHHMLANQSTNSHFVPELLRLAEMCISLLISNSWPERGASAVKRLNTRLRSCLKGAMLESLMHITINGPEVQECKSLVKKAVKEWHEVKPCRKLPNQLLRVPLPVNPQQFLMLLFKSICRHQMFQNK